MSTKKWINGFHERLLYLISASGCGLMRHLSSGLKINFSKNMAVYMTASFVYGWAGAGRGFNIVMDRWTDRPTDQRTDVYVLTDGQRESDL